MKVLLEFSEDEVEEAQDAMRARKLLSELEEMDMDLRSKDKHTEFNFVSIWSVRQAIGRIIAGGEYEHNLEYRACDEDVDTESGGSKGSM